MPSSSISTATTIAARFHALSDPTRIEIVELLRGGERCVCELTDALDAAQSRLSFHLRVLRDAELVTDRREGRWVYYTLATEVLEELETYVSDLRASVSSSRAGITTAKCCN